MNALDVELKVLIAKELPIPAILSLASVSQEWNWVSKEVWRWLIPQDMRKGITTLFSTAVELEMLGTWYLCRFMVVAPISRVFAFLVVQSLNHHYDDPVSTAKELGKKLYACIRKLDPNFSRGARQKRALFNDSSTQLLALNNGAFHSKFVRTVLLSLNGGLNRHNKLERAERKAVLFNATPRSIEYRWDADAPRPELNLFIHKQQFTQFDEWPSPPINRWPREILRLFQGIASANEQYCFMPRYCYLWVSEILFHFHSAEDETPRSATFQVTLNQLTVLCAIDEWISLKKDATGIPFDFLLKKMHLDRRVLDVTLESLDDVLIRVATDDNSQSVMICFNSDWTPTAQGTATNLAMKQEILRLKHLHSYLVELKQDENEDEFIDPYKQAIESPRRRHFEVLSVRAIANWIWRMGVDTCAICRNQIMETCIHCNVASNSGAATNCEVTWGACCHVFHLHCISRWVLTHHRICPLDQSEWTTPIATDDVISSSIMDPPQVGRRKIQLDRQFQKAAAKRLSMNGELNARENAEKEQDVMREKQLEALIVRIMKREGERTVPHVQLMKTIVAELPWQGKVLFIKKRIASLIEREYIIRVENEGETGYRYCP